MGAVPERGVPAKLATGAGTSVYVNRSDVVATGLFPVVPAQTGTPIPATTITIHRINKVLFVN